MLEKSKEVRKRNYKWKERVRGLKDWQPRKISRFVIWHEIPIA